ncbi:MAG: ATP-binding protein [Candidatus Kapabacteria bacterium]|jgi:ligand-binding sensor domain-containing protein/signal transduction histidine kinase|nr:ATP-binding protein [Candidatus Kapabacteria bacterium]
MKHHVFMPPSIVRLSDVQTNCAFARRVRYLSLLIVFIAFCSIEKTLAQQVRFKRTSVQHGLSQSSVQAMCQDRRGFLWFGTQNGLNCYDGYTMTVYRSQAGDSASLPENFIQSLYEDRSGTLWVGTLGGGLARMNPYSRRFTPISLYRQSLQSPSREPSSADIANIFAFTEDKFGRIWVGTGYGLLRVNPTSNQVENHWTRGNSPLESPQIQALFTDAQGNIWIGTPKGLWCFNPEKNSWRSIGTAEGLSDKDIRAFAPDNHSSVGTSSTQGLASLRPLTPQQQTQPSNALWIGTASGVYRVDCFQKTVNRFFPAPIQGTAVQTLCVGEGGLLWAGYAGEGLQLINVRTGVSKLLRHSPSQRESLSHNAVLSLMTDRSNILWVGTDGAGLCYFNGDEYRFEFLTNDSGSGSSIVMSMLEDKQGNIWFGTLADGLHRIQPPSEAITTYKHAPNNPRSISNNLVWALAQDRAGTLWVGTNGGGLCRFDRASGTFTSFKHDEQHSSSLPDDRVYSLLETADGTFWVATGNGLAMMNRQAGTFTTYRATPLTTSRSTGNGQAFEQTGTAISSNAVRSLYESKRGVLWIGTRGGGLNRFDRSSQTFTAFRHNPSNANSISSDEVSSIHEDAKGILWIGTANGLNRFDPANGSFSVFSEKNGLPNSFVYSVIGDERGYIWLTTGKGITRFHPQSATFNTFEEVSHRAGLEFNQDACFKDRAGYIYFGSVAGLVRFHPDSVQINYRSPPVVLTAFKKFNKPAPPDTIISEKRELHLSVDDSFIAFEFAALSFSLPEKIRYYCKLENFDTDWIDVGTKREVTYTNLEAGEYVLHVRSTNYDGIRSEEGARLHIIIHPHWWQTLWAKIAAFVLVVFCGVWLYKWRLRTIEARQQELERTIAERTAELSVGNLEITRQNDILMALNTEKNEFLGIAAHDLKSPLTSIILSASIVQQYQSRMTVDEIKDQMEHILITAKRMQETILNLLDINAIESGRFKFNPMALNIVEVVNDVVEGYFLRAQDKQITLHFNHDTDEIMMMCDRNALMQILENLISNAIKYSPLGKSVYVSVMSSEYAQAPTLFTREAETIEHLPMPERHVRVEIQDEGPGLNSEDKAMLFQKFAKLSSKPTGGEHSTGLGLSIVKKIVESMNGRVWCETELGKGAAFTIELPIVEVSQADLDERHS